MLPLPYCLAPCVPQFPYLYSRAVAIGFSPRHGVKLAEDPAALAVPVPPALLSLGPSYMMTQMRRCPGPAWPLLPLATPSPDPQPSSGAWPLGSLRLPLPLHSHPHPRRVVPGWATRASLESPALPPWHVGVEVLLVP